jgi:hypothetical protein
MMYIFRWTLSNGKASGLKKFTIFAGEENGAATVRKTLAEFLGSYMPRRSPSCNHSL